MFQTEQCIIVQSQKKKINCQHFCISYTCQRWFWMFFLVAVRKCKKKKKKKKKRTNKQNRQSVSSLKDLVTTKCIQIQIHSTASNASWLSSAPHTSEQKLLFMHHKAGNIIGEMLRKTFINHMAPRLATLLAADGAELIHPVTPCCSSPMLTWK